VLFFLHIGSRRVHIAGLTAHLDAAWVKQQARNFAVTASEQPQRPSLLLRDHDAKFTGEFDAVLESEGIEVMPVGPPAPNMNPHAERRIPSAQQECLDHFVVFGEGHLRHLLTEYTAHSHRDRPPQPSVSRPPPGSDPPGPAAVVRGDGVGCEGRRGGLLAHDRSQPA
jgi:putative transposase